MAVATQSLEELCINSIRFLAIDAVDLVWDCRWARLRWLCRFMRFNPKHPAWLNRDRFLLSAGHGSMLQYALLYLTGYGISPSDLKQFRQWGRTLVTQKLYEPWGRDYNGTFGSRHCQWRRNCNG